jgi:hypothetical protein
VKCIRSMIVLFAAAILVLVQASVAAAAPPSNDTFAGATPASPGFSEELNTTEATTDADDIQLGASCGLPLDASVWYAFTTPTSGFTIIDAPADYTDAVLVGVGTQGNLQLLQCDLGMATFTAEANTTYYVLIVDDQLDGGSNGGTLHVSFSQPPPPTVDIQIDKSGTFDSKLGSAHLTGTYTCANVPNIFVDGEANQNVGRITIHGVIYLGYVGPCDGTPIPWSATIFPFGGRFSGGKLSAVVGASGCFFGRCAFDQSIVTVQLRGGT